MTERTHQTAPYLQLHDIAEMRVDQDAPRNPYPSGYGRKVPTRYMLKLGTRWHRVYMVQYGNSGSAYVLLKGQERFLHSDVEHALEDAASDLWKAEELADEGIYSYSGNEEQIATDQALATLLWVSTDENDEPMDAKYSPEDFPEEMQLGMKKLISEFMEANLETLVKAGYKSDAWGNTGQIEQIGHDYVLTTGGHGTGFWDRGLGELGDKLTEACKAERHEWSVYVTDDGELWCDDLTGYDAGSGVQEKIIRHIADEFGWTVHAGGWGKSWKNLHISKTGMKTLHVGLHRDGPIESVSVVQRPGDPDSLRHIPVTPTGTLRGNIVDYLNGATSEPEDAAGE